MVGASAHLSLYRAPDPKTKRIPSEDSQDYSDEGAVCIGSRLSELQRHGFGLRIEIDRFVPHLSAPA